MYAKFQWGRTQARGRLQRFRYDQRGLVAATQRLPYQLSPAPDRIPPSASAWVFRWRLGAGCTAATPLRNLAPPAPPDRIPPSAQAFVFTLRHKPGRVVSTFRRDDTPPKRLPPWTQTFIFRVPPLGTRRHDRRATTGKQAAPRYRPYPLVYGLHRRLPWRTRTPSGIGRSPVLGKRMYLRQAYKNRIFLHGHYQTRIEVNMSYPAAVTLAMNHETKIALKMSHQPNLDLSM